MGGWPYHSTTWRRLRTAKLMASPLCEDCNRRGVTRAATDVDHIKAIRNGGEPFPPLAGLQSLCGSCHARKTRHVDAGGLGFVPGCDVNGEPLDPKHQWYQWDTPSKDEGLGATNRRGQRVSTKFRKG